MKAEPRDEHRWLERLVGEWTSEAEAAEPGKPPQTFRGTLSARMLGGIWLLAEGRSEEPDGGMGTMVFTLGYDPARERFVGTFVGSPMPYLWIYDGALDAGGTALALESEGPSFAGDGTMTTYRDTFEWVDADHWVLRSSYPGEGGAWSEFMVMHYRRSAS
jgi:Protein of unknown function (DUF1579)